MAARVFDQVEAFGGVTAAQSGTVNVASDGITCTLASGSNFPTDGSWNNAPITINGSLYIVQPFGSGGQKTPDSTTVFHTTAPVASAPLTGVAYAVLADIAFKVVDKSGTSLLAVDCGGNATVAGTLAPTGASTLGSLTVTGGAILAGGVTPNSTSTAALAITGLASQTAELLTVSETFGSAAPSAAMRMIHGQLTVSYAGTINMAGNSIAGLRSLVTVGSGTTYGNGSASSYLYGMQGKLIADGRTINAASGHITAVHAQMSLSGATITSGHVAGLIVAGQSWPTSTLIDGIYIESGGNAVNSALKTIFNGLYVFDLDYESGPGSVAMATTSSSVTNIGTKGWLKIKVHGIDRFIALGDGTT